VVIDGAEGGSTDIIVGGIGESTCTPTPIQVFDCGPDGICHNDDDFELATTSITKLPDGSYMIHLAKPLVPGQKIYVTDGCTDPLLSVIAVVRAPVPAPLMSERGLATLVAMLLLVAGISLTRLRSLT